MAPCGEGASLYLWGGLEEEERGGGGVFGEGGGGEKRRGRLFPTLLSHTKRRKKRCETKKDNVRIMLLSSRFFAGNCVGDILKEKLGNFFQTNTAGNRKLSVCLKSFC